MFIVYNRVYIINPEYRIGQEKYMNLLSLDGDGIKGIVQIYILTQLPDDFNSHINHYAGTSIGGISCMYLALSKSNTASGLLKIILNNYEMIFSGRNYLSFIYGPKYSSDGIKEVVTKIFGDLRLSDLETDCTIVSYDVNSQEPHYFESHKAKLDPTYDFKLVDVALATSAAPTYFNPHVVDKYMFLDGGMAANNPTFSGIITMRKKYPELSVKHINTLSIGCVEPMESPTFNKIKRYGTASWVTLAFDILMNASADVTHNNVRQAYLLGGGENYHRIDAKLDRGSSELDDTSSDNISYLLSDGSVVASKYEESLTKFYDAL